MYIPCMDLNYTISNSEYALEEGVLVYTMVCAAIASISHAIDPFCGSRDIEMLVIGITGGFT